MKKYYAMETNGREASVMIYGDITSWPWMESDVSSYNLSREIDGLDVDTIHVYINSYGGEVAEGLAIHNSLKRHKAKVVTYVDGFACSIAAVIFAAGDERVMYDTSQLMIHNAWTCATGNADELRKAAEDLEIISSSVTAALQSVTNIDADELKALLDMESWIAAGDALSMGFATRIDSYAQTNKVSASGRQAIYNRVMGKTIAQEVMVKVDGLDDLKMELEAVKAMLEQASQSAEPIKTNFWDAFSGKE